MPLDRSLLPQALTETPGDGLYAEFYEDGQLAHFGYYQGGSPRGWCLYLEVDRQGGRVDKAESRVFDAEVDDDLEEWVKNWVEVIADEAGTTPMACSFCGKTRLEVRKLIAGPRVYICDECVALCNEILEEEKQFRGDQNGNP